LSYAVAPPLGFANDDGIEAPAAASEATARTQQRAAHPTVAYDMTASSAGPPFRARADTSNLPPGSAGRYAGDGKHNDRSHQRHLGPIVGILTG
jgi:hypothetical protein